MKSILRVSSLSLLAMLLLSFSGVACAQVYPNKPIRIIVGFPPGGATDISARLVGQKLNESLGQPVVIENRPGAGSNIGAELAAKAAPDGYTLLLCTIANAINETLYRHLPFNFVKAFTPISQTTSYRSFLVVHPSLPVKSVKEFINLAKSTPVKLDYSSSGTGTTPHLAAEMFKSITGVDMVPYKGTAPELNDLLAGVVKVAFETTPAVLTHVKAGKLRALAVNSAERTPLLPDVPTMSEAGLPGFVVTSWNGLVAPTGTPKEIVARLNGEIVKILRMPDINEKLSLMGADATGSSPDQFAAHIQQEIKKWAKVIKDVNIQLE
jgi:tripartite-type tricarboxylate transporter receptor subunit TctC